jgi:UDPglucose 6-dehydrogenase
VNAEQKHVLARKILKRFGKISGRRIAVWGLAFKPNTDDMRAAPSLTIIAGLQKRGLEVVAFDPISMPKAEPLPELKGVQMAADAYDAARGAHALVIITEWNEFRTLDLAKLKKVMKKPVLCDLRNIYSPSDVEDAGWIHVGVGKGRPGKAPRPRRASATKSDSPANGSADVAKRRSPDKGARG